MKTAVVTGGGRGIGEAIVKRLDAEGVQIAIFDLQSANHLSSQLKNPSKTISVDVKSEESVSSAIKEVVNEWGRLDILVNNAGITKDGLAIRMKDDDWQAVLDINLTGAFYCSREALKVMMKQREGVIINISSVIGMRGNMGQANYAASKGGLIALTKTLAKEMAERNIRVNAIAPGFIETEMTKRLGQPVKDEILKRIPLKRFGTIDEVAELVSFLTKAEYITGQVIVIDGGLFI
ncbi:MAG: 3-oxoacyl-[acyl-carrier-protein] reductase [bacterium]|nr:3-oxoacyl-[acyl-carrier-protein] reductase [bacterium]